MSSRSTSPDDEYMHVICSFLFTHSHIPRSLGDNVLLDQVATTIPVMSLQGHTARRECEVSVGSRVQWFRGGLNDQVWTDDERNPVDCKIKTKTKLRSTTDTEAILIVESPQLIVNKCTQVRHYESYGKE